MDNIEFTFPKTEEVINKLNADIKEQQRLENIRKNKLKNLLHLGKFTKDEVKTLLDALQLLVYKTEDNPLVDKALKEFINSLS